MARESPSSVFLELTQLLSFSWFPLYTFFSLTFIPCNPLLTSDIPAFLGANIKKKKKDIKPKH